MSDDTTESKYGFTEYTTDLMTRDRILTHIALVGGVKVIRGVYSHRQDASMYANTSGIVAVTEEAYGRGLQFDIAGVYRATPTGADVEVPVVWRDFAPSGWDAFITVQDQTLLRLPVYGVIVEVVNARDKKQLTAEYEAEYISALSRQGYLSNANIGRLAKITSLATSLTTARTAPRFELNPDLDTGSMVAVFGPYDVDGLGNRRYAPAELALGLKVAAGAVADNFTELMTLITKSDALSTYRLEVATLANPSAMIKVLGFLRYGAAFAEVIEWDSKTSLIDHEVNVAKIDPIHVLAQLLQLEGDPGGVLDNFLG